MICDRFIHIGIGDTGEGVVRTAIHKYIHYPISDIGKALPSLIPFCDGEIYTAAHIPLSKAREVSLAPAFTFTRNPYDWYISAWIHQLKTHKCACIFRDWMLENSGWFTRCWKYFTHVNGEEAVTHVGKFESLQEDTIRILHALAPAELDLSYLHSWFPDAFRQWGNRPWVEGIEQWMRPNLFTPVLKICVRSDDGWALERWGYTFDDHWEFAPAPCP